MIVITYKTEFPIRCPDYRVIRTTLPAM